MLLLSIKYFFNWQYYFTLANRIALPKLTSVNSFNVKSTWKIFLNSTRKFTGAVFGPSHLELVPFLLDYECHLLSNLPADSGLLTFTSCQGVTLKFEAYLATLVSGSITLTMLACLFKVIPPLSVCLQKNKFENHLVYRAYSLSTSWLTLINCGSDSQSKIR